MTTTRKERGAPGAKAAITTASVAATLAGWAYLAGYAPTEPARDDSRPSAAGDAAPPPAEAEAAPSRGRAPQVRKPATRTRQS